MDYVSPWQPTRAVLCFWHGRLDEVNLRLGKIPIRKATEINRAIEAEYGRPQKQIQQLGYDRLWRDGGTIVRLEQIGFGHDTGTVDGGRLRPLRPAAECGVMDRAEILAVMSELKLYGMRAAFDEIIAVAVKRQHEPHRMIGDLLRAEIAEKQTRSIRYQITIAKLPLAKDLTEFCFDDTPINETLVRDLASGNFLAHQRNLVLVGGTGPVS